MGWLGCRSPSGGHISDRIIPTFTPHSFWPPSTPLLLCRVSCIPLFHAASMLPHWSSQCSGIQKAKDTPNHTCPYQNLAGKLEFRPKSLTLDYQSKQTNKQKIKKWWRERERDKSDGNNLFKFIYSAYFS